MKMYCISDNMETAIGLKLTGIEVAVVQDKEEVDSEIKKVLDDESIGILIVTEPIYELSKQEIDSIQENRKMPLLVKI